jgi:hypothetical protein
VREAIAKNMIDEGKHVDIEAVSPPIICVTKSNRIHIMARNDMLLSELDKEYSLCAVEREVYEG